ncbi:hypothetical protein [Snodgrassella sp. CFCC 13594]|uniref:hypothetical protein n=1 Tax=Snodgrassella sp. CFCC 13594 TaxID=1775559 RepID=UPI00082CA290|nr:hypothetical protein [Snodgrassella sp. CFCC 13594]
MMKKLKIVLLLILGSFVPFVWGGMLLWWFFKRATKNLTWGKIYLTLIGTYALFVLPAGSIIDYFFHTTIKMDYLWPALFDFTGLCTLLFMVAGFFNPPLVAVYDEYKPDIYRNGHKVNS